LPEQQERKEFLSPQEFVAQSGLSLATVRRYLADGRIPSVQPGGRRCRVLIPRSALIHFSLATNAEREPRPSQLRQSAPSRSTPPKAGERLPGPTPRWLTNS
jgi:excisionase family DNA binding protein